MNNQRASGVHWSIWVVGAIAVIWNGLTIVNAVRQIRMSADALAALPDAQRAIIQGRPVWATAAFAIVGVSGVLGGLWLLRRKAAAYYALATSLVAVIVQIIPFLATVGTSSARAEIAVYLLVPLAVASMLLWYARDARRKGWITQKVTTWAGESHRRLTGCSSMWWALRTGWWCLCLRGTQENRDRRRPDRDGGDCGGVLVEPT